MSCKSLISAAGRKTAKDRPTDEHGPILETCTRFLARPGFLSKAFLKKSKRRVSSMPEATCKVGFPENGRRYGNMDPV